MLPIYQDKSEFSSADSSSIDLGSSIMILVEHSSTRYQAFAQEPFYIKYKDKHLIGQGSNGSVYRGMLGKIRNDVFTPEKEVAVKKIIVPNRAKKSVTREACYFNRNNEDVCAIHIGHDNSSSVGFSTCYIAMPFYGDEDLSQVIGKLPIHDYLRRIQLTLQVLLAVWEMVYVKHLFHRDLKPQNFILTNEGIRMIDFGSAGSFKIGGHFFAYHLSLGYRTNMHNHAEEIIQIHESNLRFLQEIEFFDSIFTVLPLLGVPDCISKRRKFYNQVDAEGKDTDVRTVTEMIVNIPLSTKNLLKGFPVIDYYHAQLVGILTAYAAIAFSELVPVTSQEIIAATEQYYGALIIHKILNEAELIRILKCISHINMDESMEEIQQLCNQLYSEYDCPGANVFWQLRIRTAEEYFHEKKPDWLKECETIREIEPFLRRFSMHAGVDADLSAANDVTIVEEVKPKSRHTAKVSPTTLMANVGFHRAPPNTDVVEAMPVTRKTCGCAIA